MQCCSEDVEICVVNNRKYPEMKNKTSTNLLLCFVNPLNTFSFEIVAVNIGDSASLQLHCTSKS